MRRSFRGDDFNKFREEKRRFETSCLLRECSTLKAVHESPHKRPRPVTHAIVPHAIRAAKERRCSRISRSPIISVVDRAQPAFLSLHNTGTITMITRKRGTRNCAVSGTGRRPLGRGPSRACHQAGESPGPEGKLVGATFPSEFYGDDTQIGTTQSTRTAR